MKWWVTILFGLSLARPAIADKWSDRADRFHGGAFLHYELTTLTSIEPDVSDEPDAMAGRFTDLALAGVRLHGFLSRNSRVAYHVGFDGAAGSSIRRAGFAYDVALFPIGAVLRLGETSIIGVGAGIGLSGAVGTLDDAVTLPLEALAEIGGGRLRLLARGRASFVAKADARQGGAASTQRVDELEAMLGLRIGRHYDSFGFPSGNGYFVAVSYRELEGAQLAGITLGYSIDLAMRRSRSR
jgi:hypothetical protein